MKMGQWFICDEKTFFLKPKTFSCSNLAPIVSLFSQLSTLLHVCVVQQHCNMWTALPAGGAGYKYQLQRDGARGSAGSEEQNGSEPPGGTRHPRRGVFSWLLSELG